MAVPNFFQRLGNSVDQLGTSASLPEFGISELLAGRKATKNTFNYGGNADYGTLNGVSTANQYFRPGGVPGYSLPLNPPQTQSQSAEAPVDPFTLALQNFAATAAPGTAGGGATAAAAPANMTELNGRLYNLDNPDERMRYFQDANAANVASANDSYNRSMQEIGTSRSNLESNASRYLQQLRERKAQLQSEKENYFADLAEQTGEFRQNKSLGDVKRGMQFSSLSPNAFQSSQATSQAYADEQLRAGEEKLKSTGEEANQNFFRASNDLDYDEGQSRRQYEQDLSTLERQASDAARSRDNYINQARGQIVGSFAPTDLSQGVDLSRYGLKAYNPVAAPQADLSGFSKFTNYESLAASPESQARSGVKLPTTQEEDPLEQYLGYAGPKAKKVTNYFK
jgi:hypothetical protein